MMQSRIRAVLAILALSAPLIHGNGAALAAAAPDINSRWYYHIGGADAVMGPLNSGVHAVTIGGSLNLGAGLNCHGFDPTLGLATAANSVVNNLQSVVVNGVSGLVANLPGLILQRSNPSLYELWQEILSYANAAVSLATKSCEQMQSDIARGRNPLDHWMTLSKSYTWRDQAGRTQQGQQKIDVVSALGIVEDAQGDKGVPWAGGGNAGGKDQPPIRLVSDVVKAGYNIEQGQSLDLLGTSDGNAGGLLDKTWKNPNDAVGYAVAVLGDMEIATKNGGVPKSTPGHGLLLQIEKDRTDIAGKLSALVKADGEPSADALAKVSSSHTMLTREVITVIRKMPEREKSVAVGKLSSEAAVALNVDKALMLRRLLLSGWTEPNIYAAGVGEDVTRLVGVLDREVDQLLYETRIRKELMSSSAGAILDFNAGNDSSQTSRPEYPQGDRKPVDQGAVRK